MLSALGGAAMMSILSWLYQKGLCHLLLHLGDLLDWYGEGLWERLWLGV